MRAMVRARKIVWHLLALPAVVAVVGCACAKPAPPGFVGVWASSAEACHGDFHTTQDAAIRFTATKIQGYEWGCRIGNLKAVGADWTARLACSVEGTPSVRRVRWHLNADGTLRETEKGAVDTYVRCKDSDYRVPP